MRPCWRTLDCPLGVSSVRSVTLGGDRQHQLLHLHGARVHFMLAPPATRRRLGIEGIQKRAEPPARPAFLRPPFTTYRSETFAGALRASPEFQRQSIAIVIMSEVLLHFPSERRGKLRPRPRESQVPEAGNQEVSLKVALDSRLSRRSRLLEEAPRRVSAIRAVVEA